MSDTPKKGERWVHLPTFNPDTLEGRTARVMADPIEGYVVARYKGAVPFVCHVNDWMRSYVRAGPIAPQPTTRTRRPRCRCCRRLLSNDAGSRGEWARVVIGTAEAFEHVVHCEGRSLSEIRRAVEQQRKRNG